MKINRTADHRYRLDDGPWLPGVTGILSVIDKSGPLMTWAAKNTAEAAVEQIGNLPSLLASVGPEGVVKALTARSGWKRDEAAQLGTDVHRLADEFTSGKTSKIPDNVKQHVAHYAEWWKASGWTLRTSEAMLVNPELGYGGTLDLLALDRDKRTVLADIKTGKGVYNEVALQLTAYGLAAQIQTELGVFRMPEVDRYVVLHVTANGVTEIEIPVGQEERLAWLACMELSRWWNSVKSRRLG